MANTGISPYVTTPTLPNSFPSACVCRTDRVCRCRRAGRTCGTSRARRPACAATRDRGGPARWWTSDPRAGQRRPVEHALLPRSGDGAHAEHVDTVAQRGRELRVVGGAHVVRIRHPPDLAARCVEHSLVARDVEVATLAVPSAGVERERKLESE